MRETFIRVKNRIYHDTMTQIATTVEPPLRSELFNDDQMERYGMTLASAHVLNGSGAKNLLLKRLDENKRVLTAVCSLLTEAVKAKSRIAPAGEWLLDNFYLIEEQIRTARRHLPSGYSRELPRLANGPSIGLPRVYDLALEGIAHGDGSINSERLGRFVTAYQSSKPLTLGELWAIPIMLRLALIENLRRVGTRISVADAHLRRAEDWASQMITTAGTDPKSLILVIADMARSNPPMTGPFVAELCRRLQGHGPALALPLTWIEQRLAESSMTIEQMVRAENQHQAADHVSISNSIGSLRFLDATDWRDFVESMSIVEHTLLEDPGGVYGQMDFATRDQYRHVVDRLAKRCHMSEVDVAHTAIGLARENVANNGPDHSRHIGFYLIDQGRAQLEDVVGARLTVLAHVQRWLDRYPLALYLGTIALLTAVFTSALLAQLIAGGVSGWRLALSGLLSLLATSQLASELTNWLATLLVAPHRLPRMDYSLEIPAARSTLVVVPALINSAQDIDKLLEALEVRFLGNRDPHLLFGLLTDFRDAPTETTTRDARLLQRVGTGIEALNRKYCHAEGERFFLFHRPRRWNPAECVWMGFERKRGKLADLNALLRGNKQDCFSLVLGDRVALSRVKYVITLDTDTQLPRDTAQQLIGAMAHPLNQPRYHRRDQRVDGGYGILQPGINISLASAYRSRYARLYGSEPGIDPYTRSVSNIYQDVFGEGSFIGKGIYDVDAFEHSMAGRFPENRILSHDLLEGCYARSGLLSDVTLYEEYPADYAADMNRHERWVRGDWQIAQWLLPRVPGAHDSSSPNPLSALSCWKIFDNLRRSLVPAAMTLLLLFGWWLLPHAWSWTLALLGIFLIPPLLTALVEVFRLPKEMRLSHYLASVLKSLVRNLGQTGFRVACLPHEAIINCRAVLLSFWRMGWTHRGLLEWRVGTNRAQPDNGKNATGVQDHYYGKGPVSMYRSMWIATSFAAVVAVLALSQARLEALTSVGPIVCLWLAAPAIAWWLSQPLQRREVKLSSDQLLFLRMTARKTWAFFDQFVVASEHWLPPDNFQQQPGPVIAHRTSPTNMGMALLANLSACDFGFITGGELIERTRNTFSTMARLSRYRGHFYNWYDTHTLQPLPPRYVSSVDSGNLAGHLLTLRAGLLELPDQTIIGKGMYDGLRDTLAILIDSLTDAATKTTRAELVQLRALVNTACAQPALTFPALVKTLEPIVTQAGAVTASLDSSTDSEVLQWSRAMQTQCQQTLSDVRFLAPWLDMPTAPDGLGDYTECGDITTLRDLARRTAKLLQALDARLQGTMTAQEQAWLTGLRARYVTAHDRVIARIAGAQELARQAAGFATMDYEFLYDRSRHLLAVGYNVDDFRRDTSFYDLLASEARLGSFIAIAQGQLPQESWFALGRLLTNAGDGPILVSWNGSMFEYLMPMLVMPSYEGTLLYQTCAAAVTRQIAYGRQHALPWGVSESGYNMVDASLNYRYHAFGVPGLGLKRGLADDLVVAPYAAALALMVAPEAACANLQKLAAFGLEGRYGFYEAVDYTPGRLLRGQTSVIVRSFMAHHQGMTLLSLAHLLLNRPMQRRFHSDPMLQSTLLLLQEKIPLTSVPSAYVPEYAEASAFSTRATPEPVIPLEFDTPSPEVQLLSNGRYHVMMTNAGGGYSRWQDLAVTRWREDNTCDNWGTFIYLRDLDSGDFWSATHQPSCKPADSSEALFREGLAEYRRRDHDIETYSEIVVSPEDDIELRRLRITNRSSRQRTIEITSYAEVVLSPPAADTMQPAFSKLFVQTEIIAAQRAILCTRRPRSSDEPGPSMFHLLAPNESELGEVSFETDRMRFIGRGRSIATPRVMSEAGALSGSAGSVLDPIVAIRCTIILKKEQSVTIDLVTGVADSRAACMTLVDKYQDRQFANRCCDLARTHGDVTLHQINASEADAILYRRLAGPVLYADAALRADVRVLMQNRRGQSGLWGYSISGDLPIVLLKIADTAHINQAQQMIQCHTYWRLKGLAVDLVIWNEEQTGYRQQLNEQIMGLISTGIEASFIDRPGGIFVRSVEQIAHEDLILLQTVARAIISDHQGTLAEQVNFRRLAAPSMPHLLPAISHQSKPAEPAHGSMVTPPVLPQGLILGNDLGGFSPDGREYIITTTREQMTPAPWVNVLANPDFGTVVSESGLGYTWSENAHEFRLTPWSDDPVGASDGEAIYLRDEESGYFWSPTPMPCGSEAPYVSRHGFGYSVFEHSEGGIHSELWIYVDLKDTVKFSVLKVRNDSGRKRHLSATGYVEWVLGDLRPKSAMHVITGIDANSGALFAHNAYNTEFAGRVTFFDVDDASRTLSGDRTEFLGRNRSLRNPDAMTRSRLSGRLGAGMDPCGAIQVAFNLLDGQEHQIIFRLGAGRDIDAARALAQRLRKPGSARAALEKVQQYWQHTLSAVQVDTPDLALNVLTNGWLVYQTLACRLWARSGYYQSGGAFGFRDQLQDVMALIHAQPDLVREHLLRCAQRQFPQGDVQHWWHPPLGRGVRTRCSDDYLWLPLATCRYVLGTGDADVLNERLHFLDGRELNAEEESYYDLPGRSAQVASLYQHCVRAVEHGLRFGERGLPLMGSGDWNDGMNLVGIHGQGESVWLGFFLYEVLTSFAVLARRHKDPAFAERCLKEAKQLQQNLAEHAWDGAWYRRAWFDDGSPLGASSNAECAIDSIAQSWSVLSGGGDTGRSRQAMDALDQYLVHRDQGLIQLLQPPFDKSGMNPGYIKGYVPGVRENGGQYTHAAVWAAMAFAALGDSRRAWELLALINPVNHTLTAQALTTYKAEPYVVAADVYAVDPHVGRGGWTWYTGSAGWLYRLIVESLLGLQREGDCLQITPCMPEEWQTYSLDYRFGDTRYHIVVTQAQSQDGMAGSSTTLDGVDQQHAGVILVDDHLLHMVEVRFERAHPPTQIPDSQPEKVAASRTGTRALRL